MCYVDLRMLEMRLRGAVAETRDGSMLQFYYLRHARQAVEQFAERHGLLEGSRWTEDGVLLDAAGERIGTAGTNSKNFGT